MQVTESEIEKEGNPNLIHKSRQNSICETHASPNNYISRQ